MELTKCPDHSCPQKDTCLRFTMPIGTQQLWYVASPRFNNRCDVYIDTQTKGGAGETGEVK